MVVTQIHRAWVVLCDECHERLDLSEPEESLGLPWRAFSLPGWVGKFHACSELHEAAIRRRYER